MKQYSDFISDFSLTWNDKKSIENSLSLCIRSLRQKCKAKNCFFERLFHYLEIEEIIEVNPFHKIQIKYKEPFILPKTIPLQTIEKIMSYAYSEYKRQTTYYAHKTALRNVLILELLLPPV